MRTQDDAGAGAVAGHGHGHVDDHHGTAANGQGQLCRDIGRIPAVDFPPRSTPGDQQVDPAAILRFLDAVEDHPGVEMHSLMVGPSRGSVTTPRGITAAHDDGFPGYPLSSSRVSWHRSSIARSAGTPLSAATVAPAACPASTPGSASSTTRQRLGSAASVLAASR